MEVLLLSSVDYHNVEDESSSGMVVSTSHNAIVAATLIVCCLKKLEIVEIRHDILSRLLKLFILYPNVQKQQCPQFDALKGVLGNNIILR